MPGDSVNRGFEAEKVSPVKGDNDVKIEPEESVAGKGTSTNGSVAGADKENEEKITSNDVS